MGLYLLPPQKLSALQADVEIRASRNLGYALEVRT